MSFINSETWAWLKTAPLPVVLSICMTSFFILGSYAYSIDKDVQQQKADVVVAKAAAEKAKDAADTARRVEDKIDKLTDMVQQVVIEQAVAKAEKTKKEKK